MGVIRSLDRLHGPNIALDYCVVDVETTGLSPDTDKIIEIAAVKVRDGRIVDEFSTFVRNKTNAKAQAVNNISPEMLKGAPNQDEAVAAFCDFVGSDVLVAHNAKFDKSFIDCVRHLPNEWIDTLDVARAQFLRQKNDLASLSERLGVQHFDAHRALGDCRATHGCWLRMRQTIIDNSIDARDFPPRTDVPPSNDGIYGKRFVFSGGAGELSCRHEFMKMVWERGALLQNSVTQKTDYVVVIEENKWNASKATKGRELASKGFPTRVLSLGDFVLMVPEAREVYANAVRERDERRAFFQAYSDAVLGAVEEYNRSAGSAKPRRDKSAGRVALKLVKWWGLLGAVVFALATVSGLPDVGILVTGTLFTVLHLAVWWICRGLLQGRRLADILRPQGARKASHGDARHFSGGRKA